MEDFIIYLLVLLVFYSENELSSGKSFFFNVFLVGGILDKRIGQFYFLSSI
jgi:hypothetical protein